MSILEFKTPQGTPPKQTSRPGKKPVKKKNALVRIVSFVAMIAVVMGAVALVVYRDQLNFDALRRAIAYRKIEKDDSQSTKFTYEEDTSNLFASYRNGLIRASTTGVYIYSQSGLTAYSKTVPMTAPAVLVSGDTAAVYEIGGGNLFVFQSGRAVLQLTQDEAYAFFSASLNREGWLAVTAQAKGYKAAVRIYDNKQQLQFTWNSSAHFVSDAAVFNDCKTMAAVALGQNGTAFQSKLVLYRLDSDKQFAETDLGSRTVLAVSPMKDSLSVLSENDFLTVDNKGKIINTYSYESRYLRSFSLDGDGFSVLHLGKYAAGSLGDLVTLDASGVQIAALPISEDVLSVSAAGRYVAVLYASHLDIYSKDLELYARLDDTGSARTALMRSDGSAMLIGSGSAWLYLPQ